MISVIVYGRNDGHGYNLHKRAALSLNCLAAILTDDDEILFVDYNTPQTLPTFVESIADTLTERCIARLRVLRVPESLHRQAYERHTHLNAIEPLARNIAARRANPANRWMLSTNTDMILLPRGEHLSLKSIVSPLAEGLYHLPRYELPEAFWEALPRQDPAAVMTTIADWSSQLGFDETTLMDDWMRYDAPGDFQLFPRDALFAIDGFDEKMCHGWHVDSNLARRMWMHFGTTRSLAGSLRGYHCNHNRVASIYQGQDHSQNDASRFVFALARPDVPDQRGTWGLAAARIEEIAIARCGAARFASGVAATMAGAEIDRRELRYGVDEFFWINTAHVFPHLASALDPLPASKRIAYVGFNGRLADWLARYCQDRGFDAAVAVSSLVLRVNDDLASVRDSFAGTAIDRDHDPLSPLQPADVVVIDFSLDNQTRRHLEAAGYHPTRAGFRPPLPYADLCDLIVDLARQARESPKHPLFIFVSDLYYAIRRTVDGHFNVPVVSLNCRVRMGYARPSPAPWYDGEASTLRTDISQFSDSLSDPHPVEAVGPRAPEPAAVWFRCDDGALKYRHGWLPLEPNGVWTSGPEAMLTIVHERDGGSDLAIEFEFSRVGRAAGRRLEVDVSVADNTLARWSFAAPARRRPLLGRRISRALVIPAQLNANGRVNVEFSLKSLDEPSVEEVFSKRGARGLKVAAVRVSRCDGDAKREA
jgi:hypothetical protein